MNKKLKDRLIELAFDDEATATDVIAAVQEADDMSAEDRAMIGSVVQVSDDVKFGARSLAEQRDTAYTGYILAIQVYKDAHQRFWDYLRNAIPELDGWDFTYNADAGKAVVLHKRRV
jgi:hypothetical protein